MHESFPCQLKHLPVSETTHIILSPIEKAVENIRFQTSKLRVEIEKLVFFCHFVSIIIFRRDEKDMDSGPLFQVVQGSVLMQVQIFAFLSYHC